MSRVLIFFVWYWSATFQGWETLSQLELVTSQDELLGELVTLPMFSEELKSHAGTQVVLEGYIIPLDQARGQDYFVLSRFPYNNCFFCGNAGPETVAEVYTREPINFEAGKVQVTGQLLLNDDDPLHLFFIIEDADVTYLDD